MRMLKKLLQCGFCRNTLSENDVLGDKSENLPQLRKDKEGFILLRVEQNGKEDCLCIASCWWAEEEGRGLTGWISGWWDGRRWMRSAGLCWGWAEEEWQQSAVLEMGSWLAEEMMNGALAGSCCGWAEVDWGSCWACWWDGLDLLKSGWRRQSSTLEVASAGLKMEDLLLKWQKTSSSRCWEGNPCKNPKKKPENHNFFPPSFNRQGSCPFFKDFPSFSKEKKIAASPFHFENPLYFFENFLKPCLIKGSRFQKGASCIFSKNFVSFT